MMELHRWTLLWSCRSLWLWLISATDCFICKSNQWNHKRDQQFQGIPLSPTDARRKQWQQYIVEAIIDRIDGSCGKGMFGSYWRSISEICEGKIGYTVCTTHKFEQSHHLRATARSSRYEESEDSCASNFGAFVHVDRYFKYGKLGDRRKKWMIRSFC